MRSVTSGPCVYVEATRVPRRLAQRCAQCQLSLLAIGMPCHLSLSVSLLFVISKLYPYLPQLADLPSLSPFPATDPVSSSLVPSKDYTPLSEFSGPFIRLRTHRLCTVYDLEASTSAAHVGHVPPRCSSMVEHRWTIHLSRCSWPYSRIFVWTVRRLCAMRRGRSTSCSFL
jgi:hypothetical protein